jgi:hypothetical protein
MVAASPPEIAWVASHNGPGSELDGVSDATVRDGFLYVVGFVTTLDHSTRGYITIKYAPDGTEVWSRVYEGFVGHANNSDVASSVAVDAAGNVYVTGYSSQYVIEEFEVIYVDAATLKYSPDGELLWERRFRGSGGNVQPLAIALDPAGFVYVGGASWMHGGFNVFLLKYDVNGNLIWGQNRGQPGGQWDAAFTMALDPNGDVVLGGYTQPGLLQDIDVYVLKFASSGLFQWDWSLFGVADVEEVIDLTVDSAGNTYALAQYAPPGTPTSLLTVKLSSSGNLLWSDVYSGQSSTGDYAAGVELSPDGNIFVAGAAWENGSQNAMTLLKYTPGGQRLWVRSERGGYFTAECNDLAVDSEGAAYMTGFAFNDSEDFQYLTAKFDGAGNLLWTAPWEAPEGRTDIAYHVRVGSGGRVYVMGDAWRGFASYFDITTVAYNQNASGTGAPELIGSGELSLGARPNPTRGATSLELFLPRSEDIDLSIYDAAGRRVRTLIKGPANSGARSVTWDGRSDGGDQVAPGVYLVRLTSKTGSQVARVTRIH